MKLVFITISIFVFLISCQDNNTDVNKFKTGTFNTFLEDMDATSIAIRNDSIQIEIYNNVRDTFDIKWESNFEYILTKTRPKNELDSTPFHVKITGFENDSYTFKASYKGSKYIQKGKAIKLKD